MHRHRMSNIKYLLASTLLVLAGEAAAVTPAADAASGKGTYTRNCAACHGNGAAGAPKLGDSASWAPRIAQGVAVMARHAIDGYRGKDGYMPAKGGFNSLTNTDVTAAVAYMAGESH